MTTRIQTAAATSRGGAVDIEGADALTVVAAGEGDGLTAEHLYAAALATCLHQAVVLTASERGVDAEGSSVTVEVTLTHDGAQEYGLAAVLALDRRRSTRRPGGRSPSRPSGPAR